MTLAPGGRATGGDVPTWEMARWTEAVCTDTLNVET